MEHQRNEAHFWRGESERDDQQGALRLTLPEEGELEVEGLPEGLKNSLRRPAASLLRLATLSDFRPSNER